MKPKAKDTKARPQALENVKAGARRRAREYFELTGSQPEDISLWSYLHDMSENAYEVAGLDVAVFEEAADEYSEAFLVEFSEELDAQIIQLIKVAAIVRGFDDGVAAARKFFAQAAPTAEVAS